MRRKVNPFLLMGLEREVTTMRELEELGQEAFDTLDQLNSDPQDPDLDKDLIDALMPEDK